MSKLIISIIVPVFNTGILLSKCICSIVEQAEWNGLDLPPFEVVIVDDLSTDPATIQLLKVLPATDSRIRVLQNSGPRGAAGARNFGVSQSHGDWIAFLDSDDTWTTDSIARRWEVANSYPEIQWICADWAPSWPNGRVESTGQIVSRLNRLEVSSNVARIFPKPVELVLRHIMPWSGAVMIKKSAFEQAGGFNHDLRRAEDYDLWLRLAVRYDIGFMPAICAYYLQREGSLTSRGVEPAYLWATIVLRRLIKDFQFFKYKKIILNQLIESTLSNCYEYRINGEFRRALRESLLLLRTGGANYTAIRQGVAAILRRD